MNFRLSATAIATMLIAGACSGAADSNEALPEDETTSLDEGVSAAAVTDDGDSSATEQELFNPFATDEPFDLSGGAVSSDDGVEVAEDPLADLTPIVGEATAPWPTDWSRRTIDPASLGLGLGVVDPRDVIRPIDEPRFEPIADATWLGEREPGALVQFNDEVRFYPLSILTRHEIVNDRFGDIPVAVTFCPLCNTALAFDARVDGERIRFGVSGLLRNSDLVMWDEETTSLWQQVTGEGIVGQYAGTKLEPIATSIVAYGQALENFPQARSLSTETGFGNEYGINSYANYSTNGVPFRFDGEIDDRFPALSRVVGVTIEAESKAYPFSLIRDTLAVNDEVAATPIVVFWGGDTADALAGEIIANNEAIGTAIAFDRRVGNQLLTFASADDGTFIDAETGTTWSLLGRGVEGPLAGEQLVTVTHRNEFWFAWAAFFPEAAVYSL